MASTGRRVGFESWLERHLMLLDFDPDVAAVSSRPFWLHWPRSTLYRALEPYAAEDGSSAKD
jgi:hypothetical protein